jgi:hypothetical protein
VQAARERRVRFAGGDSDLGGTVAIRLAARDFTSSGNWNAGGRCTVDGALIGGSPVSQRRV